MFVGNERGGRTASVFFSLVVTCKNRGIDPRTYLQDTMLRLREGVDPKTLTPAQWQKRYAAEVESRKGYVLAKILGKLSTPKAGRRKRRRERSRTDHPFPCESPRARVPRTRARSREDSARFQRAHQTLQRRLVELAAYQHTPVTTQENFESRIRGRAPT